MLTCDRHLCPWVRSTVLFSGLLAVLYSAPGSGILSACGLGGSRCCVRYITNVCVCVCVCVCV